jgi:peptidoglycan hydrolase CwlO-like protein
MNTPPLLFASVVETNYAPNDAEISDIQRICLQKLEEIQTLNREIHSLQKTLGDLKAQHQDLQEYLESYQALMSPICYIFPEILQLIFKFCLPLKML